MSKREGCLRPEFEQWYPTLRSGVWYPADELTTIVLKQLQEESPRWHSDGRVPSDSHFQFRGGHAGGPRHQKARRLDPRD
ncbi:MAG TPA: hypothetical protein VFN08_06975 [Gemmatimonadales bacterium]|jgi:hypothetical protein|nr:hypothetical protein [Gemmatimonadales bacterium]